MKQEDKDKKLKKYIQQLQDIGEEASEAGDHSAFLTALGAVLVDYELYLLDGVGEKKSAMGLALVCATLKQLKNSSTDDLPFDEFITVPTND